MTHAAEQWTSMDGDHRLQFAQEISAKHQLTIISSDDTLAESKSLLPYLYFLKEAIERHQNLTVVIKQSHDSEGVEWFWIDIPVNSQIVRIGFPRKRIGVQPPQALIIVLMAGLILTLITAIVLTRRLTIPFERLYHAAHDIGKGHWPEPIKEEGPTELRVLVNTFNRMNKQVKGLLANRTTLLAGIAHDLRTPLTQIQLALEMLPKSGGDPELMESIKSDLDSINHLISESLSIGLELAEEEKDDFDIATELIAIMKQYPKNKINLTHPKNKHCMLKIQVLALRRIINNLIENAIRYGKNEQIDIYYECNSNRTIIKIKDRGFGIPADQIEAVFQPFYRLEQSRGTGTGGSGLGLAIVRQLADSHNWIIELKTRKGGGTTAHLTLNN